MHNNLWTQTNRITSELKQYYVQQPLRSNKLDNLAVSCMSAMLAMGLVGPVSVYCNWVRQKVKSATSILMWEYIHLSKQICPWDTLACCWDTKQPTNCNNNLHTMIGGNLKTRPAGGWRWKSMKIRRVKQQAGWLNMTDYIDPFVTHVGRKEIKIEEKKERKKEEQKRKTDIKKRQNLRREKQKENNKDTNR